MKLRTYSFIVAICVLSTTLACTALNGATATGGTRNAKCPLVSNIKPSIAPAGDNQLTLNVVGSNFTGKSVVLWNGRIRRTTVINSTQVAAAVYSSDVAAPGTAQIAVQNTNTGAISNSVTFTIAQPAALSIATMSIPSGVVGTSYSTSLSASGGISPYSWILASGALPAGVSLSTTGTVSGTPSTTGQYTFTAKVIDSSSPQQAASQQYSMPVAGLQLTITTSLLPSATVNSAYSATLTASGGTSPYSWSVAGGSLPAGLALSSNGAVSGTPSTAGTYTFTAQVMDSGSPQQASSKQYSISVSNTAATLTISTTSLPSGTTNTAYSASLTASGGTTPYSWSVAAGSLPAGLSLATNGAISGTPSTAGTYAFTALVKDSGSPQQSASQQYSVVIASAASALKITTTSVASGTVNTSYSSTLSASGGTMPYNWSIASGSLPPGISLTAATGVLSGTPTQSGQFVFTAKVTDSTAPAAQSASAQYTMTINAPPSGSGSLSVQVSGTTSTQVILSYTAPSTSACTVLVSENSSFTPLVHDIDPALFPASNYDSGGSVNRTFVVGKRIIGSAADGYRYSRALQADTTHYFQVTCGLQVGTGTFTTMNIPIGNTFGEKLQQDPTTGAVVMPTLFATRNATLIDPLTGAFLSRVTLDADGSPGNYNNHPNFWNSGAFQCCNHNKTSNGYYLLQQTGTQGWGQLYSFDPTTGTSHFLGVNRVGAGTDANGNAYGIVNMADEAGFDSSDPKTFYAVTSNGSGKIIIVKLVYTGDETADAAPGSLAPLTVIVLTPTTGNHTLTDMLTAFDPTFVQSNFIGCQTHGLQGKYLTVGCRRAGQDSSAWIATVDMGNYGVVGSGGTESIAAATPMYAAAQSRWCGQHSNYYMGDIPMMYEIAQQLHGGAADGPYNVTLSSSMTSTATTMGTNGEPVDNNNFNLMPATVGDVFQFSDTGEKVRITTKFSPTSWQVARGCTDPGNGTAMTCSGTGSPHSASATAMADCATTVLNGAGMFDVFWDFLNDPHGTDTTNTKYIAEKMMFGGHRTTRTNTAGTTTDIMAPNPVRIGPLPSTLNTAISFSPAATFTFAGASGTAEGNTYQKHPSYENWTASGTNNVNWWLDGWNYQFSGAKDTATLLGTYLYRYNFAAGQPWNPTVLPYFAMWNATPLLDISGPGSVLHDTIADNGKFCAVKNAGECVAGSTANQVYFNVASLSILGCNQGEVFSPGVTDICIQNTAGYAQGVVQIGATAESFGGQYSRALTKGIFAPYRGGTAFAHGKSLPDASWAFVPVMAADSSIQTYALKLPSYFPTSDGIDRTTFEDVTVSIGAATNASHARVKYGYEENGARTNFYCTQRQESCYWSNQSLALNSTQTLPIGIPQRIVFYQVEFLDGSNNVVAVGPVTPVTVQ